VAERRFKVGDYVRVVRPDNATAMEVFLDGICPSGAPLPPGVWKIVRVLPADQTGFQYHIQADQGIERLVHESQLDLA
jgi:hypothetical protein